MWILRLVLRWLDSNAEKSIILISYILMSGIIFVEVIRRFVLKEQAAWSTTVPIYLFLFITWMGCAYNVKLRTHLSFTEVRTRLSYRMQFFWLLVDAALWIGFASIVVFHTIDLTYIAYQNFSIVQGTDNVMQWWFYAATPLSWSVLVVRVLQNVWRDCRAFRAGEPLLLTQSVLGE